MKLNLLLLGLTLIHVQSFGQPAGKLTVDADKPLCEIQLTMFEELLDKWYPEIQLISLGYLYAAAR